LSLNLSKLARAQSSAIVSNLAGGKALPADLLEQILVKTDGVPLFVEELTKTILESGELKDAGDQYDYTGAAHTVTIPATLRDSLMARLDRAMPVKQIAQMDDGLGELTESGLAISEKNADRFSLPEFHRRRGELLLASSSRAESNAEACFQEAIQIARAQDGVGKLFELRADRVIE